MIFTDKDIGFFKRNKKQVLDLFERRVAELTEEIFNTPPGEIRDKMIMFVQEFKLWIKEIKLVIEEKDNPQDMGI